MIESILVYGFLALFMILCGAEASKRERILTMRGVAYKGNFYDLSSILLPVLAFTFVFGCRYYVGVDYPHYLYRYLHAGHYTLRETEFLFGLITHKMAGAGIHYSIYFSLLAFIEIFLVYYTFRHHKYLYPFLAFYLIFGFYFMSMMNVIRQQIAACIFMASLQYINQKKIWHYVFCVVLAMQFHRSAFLLFFFYPFFYYRQDWFPKIKWQLVFYLAAFVFYRFYQDRLVEIIEVPFQIFLDVSDYDEIYSINSLGFDRNKLSNFGNNTGFGIYVRVFLALPIILYSSKLKKFYHSSFFNMIYTIWFIRIIAEFIIGDSLILNRPFVYVVNYKLVMLSFFTYYCFCVKKSLPLALSLSFIFLHFVLLFNLLYNGEVNTSKFMFFWEV